MLDLIATVVACCEGARKAGPGHPPAETVRVLAALRRFLRESPPWRSLKATHEMVSGSTLRRALERRARTGLLAQVHALLVATAANSAANASVSATSRFGGIATVFADKGRDAEGNRDLCRRFGAEPCIHKRRQPNGSGLGQRRWPVERSNA